MPLPTRMQRGRAAERRAMWYLWRRGWRIQAMNWYGSRGELDLVASRWRTLLIVEVRHRASHDAAWASIDEHKRRALQRTARELVERFELWQYELRYDLIAVDEHGRIARHKRVFK